jgi:hypothetical protein
MRTPILNPLVVAVSALVLATTLVLADPAVIVRYTRGIPQIELDGNWPQSHYTVYRAASPTEVGERITAQQVLCLERCFAADPAAEPGVTYWYRFELTLASGDRIVFGPYAVTISPELAARVAISILPNPVRDGARIDLRIGGTGDVLVRADAAVLDLQGRRVRTLARGWLARGTTSIRWDARDDQGRLIAPGTYFVRLATPQGTRVERLLRVQ